MQPGETITPGGTQKPPVPPAPREPAAAPGRRNPDMEVTWTASEYIAHQKNSGWYLLVGLGAIALALLIYLITGDVFSGIIIVVVGVIFAIGASRQPRTLEYGVSHIGVQVGEKFYPYADFKSFAIMDEDAIDSIVLQPMKRFMPGLSLYYPPDQEEEIMAVLGTYLPREQQRVDPIDRLARRLRF